jgi:hypothetical protein
MQAPKETEYPLPQTHTDSHRQRLFFSPVDLTGEEPPACGAGSSFHCRTQPFTATCRTGTLSCCTLNPAARSAQSFPSGNVAGGKNLSSVCVCVGLWLKVIKNDREDLTTDNDVFWLMTSSQPIFFGSAHSLSGMN